MTKHVSPEIAGTELIATDYIRAVDGAVMRECETGWFEAKRGNSPTVSEDTGPLIGDMESFDDTKESPEYVSLKWAWSERGNISTQSRRKKKPKRTARKTASKKTASD
jgi:hypothetical protein